MTALSESVDSLRARLEMISSSDAADLVRQAGMTGVVMRGLRPIVQGGTTVAGRVRTLRFLPDREDVPVPPAGAVNRGLYDSMQPGEVLVIDAMGSTENAVIGDMMYSRLAYRGVRVIVVDGAVRDAAAAEEKGMIIHAAGCSPKSFARLMRAWDVDRDVQCGGVLVRPGDWIVADKDGIVVVPVSVLPRVLEGAQARRDDDRFSQALFAAGCELDDAYPLPSHMRTFKERFLQEGALPTAEQILGARQR
jgi:regulator of RNase E activity RraA